MPDKITNKNADIILFLLKKGLGVFRKDLYLLRKLQDLFSCNSYSLAEIL